MLPFHQEGDVLDLNQDDPVVESMPCSIWPARQRSEDAGEVYDHEAECPLEHHAAVNTHNRRLVVDGVTYVIVEAHAQEFVPHVALRLKKVKPGG